MNKARDTRKDAKKAPGKTLKEKRSDKHLKKEARDHPEYLIKPLTGSSH